MGGVDRSWAVSCISDCSRLARPIDWQTNRRNSYGSVANWQARHFYHTNLPDSLFRELNEQAQAFNAMLAGLRWFEAYVPKRLVRQLMHQGAVGLPVLQEREVTILFTDIVASAACLRIFRLAR